MYILETQEQCMRCKWYQYSIILSFGALFQCKISTFLSHQSLFLECLITCKIKRKKGRTYCKMLFNSNDESSLSKKVICSVMYIFFDKLGVMVFE